MADKKYYWLKMSKDFFDRHEIKIIEAAGKDYVLFYIKLMLESVSHNGELRFSEKVPYTREMLASVTNTEMDVVNGCMDFLMDLGLVEYDDDGTYLLTKVPGMIGSAAASDSAIRQQRYRDKKKTQKEQEDNASETDTVTKSNASVTEGVTNDNESIEYRDKSIEYRNNIGYLNTLGYEVEEEGSSATATAIPIDELTEERRFEIICIWNSQTMTRKINGIHPLSGRENKVRLCIGRFGYEKLIEAIEDIDQQAWFQKLAAEKSPVKFDWFCNPDNLQKVIEGNYADERKTENDAYKDWEVI